MSNAKVAAEPAFVPAPAASTNVLAIVSLVTGIAGLTFVPFFGSIAAVITGHISLNQLKRKQENGRGMALAGLITGYVGVGFMLLGLIALIGFVAMIIQMGGFDVVFDGNGMNGGRMPMRGYGA